METIHMIENIQDAATSLCCFNRRKNKIQIYTLGHYLLDGEMNIKLFNDL